MEPVITLLGLQMPTLIPLFIIASLIQMILNKFFSDFGFYQYVWHPGLFRTALFLCIFSIPAIFIYQ